MSLRVLQVLPGPVPPPSDPTRAEFYHIAGDITGDILLPTWAETAEELRNNLGSYPTYPVNKFTYHMNIAGPYPYGTLLQKWYIFHFHVKTALALARQKKYDVVKAYGTGLTGLTALLIAKLIRAKLIIEMPSAPEDSYRYARFGNVWQHADKPDLRTLIARVFARWILYVVVLAADRVHLLYPWQLQKFPMLRRTPATVIPTFAPVSLVPNNVADEKFVLLVGAPWYVKGVDILIHAWRKIEDKFPDYKLKLVGYVGEKERLRAMIGDSQQIELLQAMSNPEVLDLMSRSSLVVLASRTEGGPRVFVEGMAAGKALIGSKVGGVAYYVREGQNGLLFEREDVDGLASRLQTLLAAPELRDKFGKASREIALTEMHEGIFGRRMQELFEITVNGRVPELEEQAQAAT